MFRRFKLSTKAAAERRSERCFKIGLRIFLVALVIFLIGPIVKLSNFIISWVGWAQFYRGWGVIMLLVFLVGFIFLFFSAIAQLKSYNLNHDQNKSLPS